ncbi:hypothetical protein GCM10025857_55990 [Alicyclobacillus contaminans]|nr:hypothetical protein GCM10025857_55990 [Alicyclobacillus contaminans]
MNGPPISTAIIVPTIIARTIELVPWRDSSQFVNPVNRLATGVPIIYIKIKPTIRVDIIGIKIIGITDWTALGTGIF